MQNLEGNGCYYYVTVRYVYDIATNIRTYLLNNAYSPINVIIQTKTSFRPQLDDWVDIKVNGNSTSHRVTGLTPDLQV